MDLSSLPSRLKDNQYLKGPDHYGCINTGFAPILMKSKDMRKFPDLAKGFKFLVGPDMFSQDALRALMIHHKVKGRTYTRNGRYKVKFYKKYKSAKAEFTRQVKKIQDANKAEAHRHLILKTKARQGDMQAVTDLIDYT